MSSEMQRRYATDETFREVANLLFGGGAEGLVSKLSPEKEKAQRRQAQVGLASNVVGIAAGAAGTAAATREFKARKAVADAHGPKHKGKGKVKIKLKPVTDAAGRIKTKHAVGLAGGALALQGANLGGDFVANRVLARSAKKKDDVHKSEPGSADIHIPTTNRLKRVAAEKAYEKGKEKAPTIKRGTLKVINETPEVGGKVKEYVKGKKAEVGKSITWEGEISKVDSDKRQVFGWASIVEMNGQPVVDLQGDWIDHDELEKSAYDYVIKSRKGGNMHARNGEEPLHVSDMIESFLVTPEKKEALSLPDEMPTGWWVGYQINDDEAWNLVKSGKRTGFSIHGRGQRTPMEAGDR